MERSFFVSITRAQYDEIVTCYEESLARRHNSRGAWHMMLIAAVRAVGCDVRNFNEAKRKAKEIIHNGC